MSKTLKDFIDKNQFVFTNIDNDIVRLYRFENDYDGEIAGKPVHIPTGEMKNSDVVIGKANLGTYMDCYSNDKEYRLFSNSEDARNYNQNNRRK